MFKIYRKTATIKAEQFDPENGVIPEGVFDKEFEHTTSGMISQMVNELKTGEQAHNWHVKTLEGDLKVNPGDWIATGINGEHWPIADDVFKKTYAELPLISEKLDSYIQLYKRNNYGITDMLYDLTDEVCPDVNLTKDDIARAWLDGYQVEE